jgi:hypothetical protein
MKLNFEIYEFLLGVQPEIIKSEVKLFKDIVISIMNVVIIYDTIYKHIRQNVNKTKGNTFVLYCGGAIFQILNRYSNYNHNTIKGFMCDKNGENIYIDVVYECSTPTFDFKLSSPESEIYFDCDPLRWISVYD